VVIRSVHKRTLSKGLNGIRRASGGGEGNITSVSGGRLASILIRHLLLMHVLEARLCAEPGCGDDISNASHHTVNDAIARRQPVNSVETLSHPKTSAAYVFGPRPTVIKLRVNSFPKSMQHWTTLHDWVWYLDPFRRYLRSMSKVVRNRAEFCTFLPSLALSKTCQLQHV